MFRVVGSRLLRAPCLARLGHWWMTSFHLLRCATCVTQSMSEDTKVNPTISRTQPLFYPTAKLFLFFFFFKNQLGKKKKRSQQNISVLGFISSRCFLIRLWFPPSSCHDVTRFYSAAHQANSSPPTYQTLLSSQPFKHTSGWDQVLPPSIWGKTSCLFSWQVFFK